MLLFLSYCISSKHLHIILCLEVFCANQNIKHQPYSYFVVSLFQFIIQCDAFGILSQFVNNSFATTDSQLHRKSTICMYLHINFSSPLIDLIIISHPFIHSFIHPFKYWFDCFFIDLPGFIYNHNSYTIHIFIHLYSAQLMQMQYPNWMYIHWCIFLLAVISFHVCVANRYKLDKKYRKLLEKEAQGDPDDLQLKNQVAQAQVRRQRGLNKQHRRKFQICLNNWK